MDFLPWVLAFIGLRSVHTELLLLFGLGFWESPKFASLGESSWLLGDRKLSERC